MLHTLYKHETIRLHDVVKKLSKLKTEITIKLAAAQHMQVPDFTTLPIKA